MPGYWLRANGRYRFVDEEPDQPELVSIGKRRWRSRWKLKAFGNRKYEVFKALDAMVARDLRRLRHIRDAAIGTTWSCVKRFIANALEHVDADLVTFAHREERTDAVATLLADDPNFLYLVPYKTNDTEEAVRLSFLLHELTHIDADQRYRFHESSAMVLCLNANGDPDDEDHDREVVGARLEAIDQVRNELLDLYEQMPEGKLKTYLEPRINRSGMLVNEWDSVMTELCLYFYLKDSSRNAVVQKIRECALAAFAHRSTHAPRGRTPRPGGIN